MVVALALLLMLPQGATGRDPGTLCSDGTLGPVACIRPQHAAFDICQHVAGAAHRHVLDPGFLARLLWQESRFDPNARSPAGAEGIAQFMPGTAGLRGLADSYNPAEAMERSAHYLAELVQRYGNPGLAAVAYNGGEARADGFLQGGGLARETVDYVRIITGLGAELWRDAPPPAPEFGLADGQPFMQACLIMAKARKVSPLTVTPNLPKWGAQVGFGTTRGAARDRFARVQRQCTAAADARADILKVPNRVRGRPAYHMVRVSYAARDAADRFCSRIRRQGCPCAVYKNW